VVVDDSDVVAIGVEHITGRWVAVRRHDHLTITVAGHDPSTIALEPMPDPAARLLGPQPEDA
jgi:hypothetical protein